MKRSKLLSLLLVGALSASLVACGSASGSTLGQLLNIDYNWGELNVRPSCSRC